MAHTVYSVCITKLEKTEIKLVSRWPRKRQVTRQRILKPSVPVTLQEVILIGCGTEQALQSFLD